MLHLCATALALATGPGAPAPKTVVPPMFYSEIVNTAHQIVTGTVTGSTCRYERGRETIATLVTFENLTVHKGTVGEKITLRLEGGSIGDDHLRVPLMPKFHVGKRYLVYVDGLSGKKVSPIVGFHQGAFEITIQNGRETLVSMLGDELVGIQNDRFVFAGKPAPRSANPAPEAVLDTGAGFKPADPDVEAKEVAQKAKEDAAARAAQEATRVPVLEVGNGTTPPLPTEARLPAHAPQQRKDAAPIVVTDNGVRMSASSLLSVRVEVK